MRQLGDRGATPVVGNLLLIGVAVVVGVVVTVSVLPLAEDVGGPPQAALDVEQVFVAEEDAPTNKDWVDCDGANGELAVSATLTQLNQADRIYVIVADEDATRKKVVWSDPSDDQVGTSKLLINEVDYGSNWVDIGGGSDWGLCPGESATFRFYGEYEDETYLIRKVTVG
jgi:FlaG/FlaF family flagellin (archaellin)